MAKQKTKTAATTAEDKPLRLEEVGERINRSRWSVRRLIEGRALKAIVLKGGTLGVMESEVRRYLGTPYEPKSE